MLNFIQSMFAIDNKATECIWSITQWCVYLEV